MNKKLEEEWKAYCAKQGDGTMISVNIKDVVQHFYKLALEDVKDEVRKYYEGAVNAYNPQSEDADYFNGKCAASVDIYDFIDELTKK